MRKFWWKSDKEDADSTSCGKKTIYLQDFHRTCIFSAEFEWDLNESTGEGSQGQCVLMIATPGSNSYKVIISTPTCFPQYGIKGSFMDQGLRVYI